MVWGQKNVECCLEGQGISVNILVFSEEALKLRCGPCSTGIILFTSDVRSELPASSDDHGASPGLTERLAGASPGVHLWPPAPLPSCRIPRRTRLHPSPHHPLLLSNSPPHRPLMFSMLENDLPFTPRGSLLPEMPLAPLPQLPVAPQEC